MHVRNRWKNLDTFDQVSIIMATISIIGFAINLGYVFLGGVTGAAGWLFFLAFAIFPVLFPTLFVQESSGTVFLVSVVLYLILLVIGALLLFSGLLNDRFQRIIAFLVFLASIIPVFVFALEAGLLLAAFGH